MNTGFLGPAVATVLTACGIETSQYIERNVSITFGLQQYLPLAVLKPINCSLGYITNWLQQYLPLAVLKPQDIQLIVTEGIVSCNSTYRLRY